jgi:hypothetical protein
MRTTMAAAPAANIEMQVAALQGMTLADLRETYHEVFGEETRSRHKDFLRKRIAWRLQANEEGDLSERAKRRAAELANDADIRVRVPAGAFDGAVGYRAGKRSATHSRMAVHASSTLIRSPQNIGWMSACARRTATRRAAGSRRNAGSSVLGTVAI